MPQGPTWYIGMVMFDVTYEIKGEHGRAYFKMWCPSNYQPKDAEKERGDSLAFEAWDDTANDAALLSKGDLVCVIARAGSFSVEKEGGKKDYRMKLVAERISKIEAPAAD